MADDVGVPAFPASGDVPCWPVFPNAEVLQDPGSDVAWCRMRPTGRPSFTDALLDDLVQVQAHLRARAGSAGRCSVRTLVLGSDVPGVFNLGGDLDLFRRCIAASDRPALRRYARKCVEVLAENAGGYGGTVETVALVQGAALGGGFEGALSCSAIVAERRATFGLPEVTFGLFPGMGAYSFLRRRVGAAAAEALIVGGKVHSAEEMHAMGVVDVLVDDGCGEEAVREFVSGPDGAARRALWWMRRRFDAAPSDELLEITERWVDCAFRTRAKDVRLMGLLVSAQDRLLRKVSA